MKVTLVYCAVGVAGFNADRPLGDREGSVIGHGIASIGASTKAAGYDVDLIDLRQLSGWDAFGEKIKANPADVYGISIAPVDSTYITQCAYQIKTNAPDAKIIVGGIHPSIFPETYNYSIIDTVVIGEGEITFPKLLEDIDNLPRVIKGEKPDLDKIPWVDRELFDYRRELSCNFAPNHCRTVTMIAGRGCPYKCLSGDTPIHTLEGIIPIQQLVGKAGIKVLTRNPKTQEPVYAAASHIWKTQESAELVRVHFDDDSHIDCTPDHRFKVFKSKNQYIDESEWDVEAKDLKPKQQVRAVRFETNKAGRIIVSTRRDINKHHARIIMEAVLGRSLKLEERVHHKDKIQGNDHPDNLILTDNHNHISKHHPEVSERMKANNPTKNMTPEWREKIGQAGKGRKFTLEHRMKLRESKLGKNNPMYKPDPLRRRTWPSRIKEVNHKVTKVERLPYRADVFCMEVPGYDWFYANKVLVHNCTYCQPAENAVYGKPFRIRSPFNVVSELEYLYGKYQFNSITFWDDTFTFSREFVMQFCYLYRDSKVFDVGRPEIMLCSRADIICKHPDMVKELSEIGVNWMTVGLETGSQRLLDFIKKGTTVEQNIEAVEICKRYGVNVFATIMLGLPTESKEETQMTVNMINTSMPSFVSPFWYVPIPGTELYNYCDDNDLILNKKDTISRTGLFRPTIKGIDYHYLKGVMGREVGGF